MTPRRIETSNAARENVLSRLDAALYWWIEEERFLLESGRETESRGAHQYVLWVDRALKSETNDPTPPGLEHPHHTPIPGCPRCES